MNRAVQGTFFKVRTWWMHPPDFFKYPVWGNHPLNQCQPLKSSVTETELILTPLKCAAFLESLTSNAPTLNQLLCTILHLKCLLHSFPSPFTTILSSVCMSHKPVVYQAHHWPPWPWFHHLLPLIHPPYHQMINFPEIIICSKPTNDFSHLSHLLFTRVVFRIVSVKLGKRKWPAQSLTARMRAEIGTQVFFPEHSYHSVPHHDVHFADT